MDWNFEAMGFWCFAYVVLGFLMIPSFLNWSMPRRFVYSIFFPFVFPFALMLGKRWNTRGTIVESSDDILGLCFITWMFTLIGYGLIIGDGDMVLRGCILAGLFTWCS